MKLTKYLAIALGLVTILLAVGWFLRNTIIERISNPVLGQYGLKITDVSLDALATSDATISYLELEHVNGTTIAIDDLTLPIGTSANRFKTYTASKITITLPADGDDAPLDGAQVLGQVLALPLLLPQTEVIVTELSAAPYPAIHDLTWQAVQDRQQLAARIASTVLTATVDRIDDNNHALIFSFADMTDKTAIQSIMVDIRQTDVGISLSGRSTLDLPRWMPIVAMLGVDAVDVESGSATVRFDTEIPVDPGQVFTLHADFAPTTPVQITYTDAADTAGSVMIESARPFEITASLPDLQWAVRQAAMSFLITYGQFNDIHVSLVNLSCQSAPACSSGTSIVMENAALPIATVGRLEFVTTQDLSFHDDGIEIRIQPNAVLGMTNISDPGLELARLDATLTSAAKLIAGDGGWKFEAASVDAVIKEYSVMDDLTFSATVFLDDVSCSDSGDQLSAKTGIYASSSQARWENQVVRLPGFKGGIDLRGADVAVLMETAGLSQEAHIQASHNLDKDTGRLSMRGGALSFDTQKLSKRVAPWRRAWDVIAGTVALDLQAEWHKPAAEWQVAGQAAIRVSDLAGAYNDTAFAGLSTSLEAGFDPATGIAVEPSNIAVTLLDVGLPIENITADYTLHPNDLSADVQNLHMTVFGGVIRADPFSFHTAGDSNTLLLQAESIDLGVMLSIEEFKAIQVSGRIGATLPVTIEGKTITIAGGRLTGEPPGGVIRYLPGVAANNTEATSLGFATRALSNFEYKTLTSEVEYTRDGDLNLQMHLTGRNPDLEGNRPVVLNLGVENNVPQMLRSLQAARAVEDVLEKRLVR